jgi:predicted transposase/invertase (TIGR01784 family)
MRAQKEQGTGNGKRDKVSEAKTEMAANLLSMSIDENIVTKATGLSLEDVRKLRK